MSQRKVPCRYLIKRSKRLYAESSLTITQAASTGMKYLRILMRNLGIASRSLI
jgi:hypothetical protein